MELTIRQGLTQGLSRTSDAPRNSETFSALAGAKATPYGFAPYVSLPNPLAKWMTAAGVEVSWPFPQLHRGQQATLLFGEAEVYLVDETEWTGTALEFHDLYDTTYTYAVQAGGGAWHIVDLGDPVLAFNDKNVLLMYAQAGVYYGQQRVTAKTGCAFRGRVLLGGFDVGEGAFWNAEWQAIAELLNEHHQAGALAMAHNAVWWSMFGAVDVLWLFWPILALYGPAGLGPELVGNRTLAYGKEDPDSWVLGGDGAWDDGVIVCAGEQCAEQALLLEAGATYVVGYEIRNHKDGAFFVRLGGAEGAHRTKDGYYWEELVFGGTPSLYLCGTANLSCSVTNITARKVVQTGYGLTRPFIADMLERGDGGAYPMPWQGRTLAVRALDTVAVAYCEDGVAALVPHTDPPTFGYRRLVDQRGQSPRGLASRGAVGGDEYTHVFVDRSGSLWRLTDAGLEWLDYRWLLSGLEDVVVAYDPVEHEFYIGGARDGTNAAYVLTETGMAQSPQSVTSIVVVGGQSSGIAVQAGPGGFRAVTETLDMGTRLMKTVTEVELGLSSGSNTMTVTVEYKTSREDTVWARSSPVALRGKGVAHLVVSGVEFRVVIEAQSASVEIDYIKLAWRLDGKVSAKHLLGGA